MNTTNGISKPTERPTSGRHVGHKALPLLLALLCASSVAISAAKAQEPIPEEDTPESPSRACECGCVYCCAEEPAEGVGRVPAPIIRTDALDYTNGVLWGWDGRYCDLWEMELFAKVMYLEFWGTSPECCEAGCDAMLRLLESGEYGDTLGELMSAEYAPGKYVYSVYPAVETTDYDEDGLNEMRTLCKERFSVGPVWIAPYFRKDHYHEWGTPAYNLNNVFFSVASWGE